MRASLDGPISRVRVTGNYINALDQAIQTFFKEHPHRIAIEKNIETGKCEAVIRDILAVPSDFSIYAGMIAHNLRAALDGLACQLAYLNAGGGDFDRICENVMFPIRINGPRSRVRSKIKHESRFSWGSDAFKPLGKYLAPLVRLQPYKVGNRRRKNPLWLLSSLNNTDKHRTLILFVVGHVGTGGQLPTRRVRGTGFLTTSFHHPMKIFAGVPFRDGAKIAEIEADSPNDVNVQFRVTTSIRFGSGCKAVEGLPVIQTLRQIHAHVGNIVESFTPEFL